VPFKEGFSFYEGALQRNDGKTNKGAFGRAVRNLTDLEYDTIVKAGFVKTLFEAKSDDAGQLITVRQFEDEESHFERPMIEMIVERPFRDAAFATSVRCAYDNTCAMTGIKIINGGGHAEVQAAHIRPVAAGGSDSVRNGLALSGTVHWMFDRGLVSVDDDFSILIAAGRLPPTVTRMFRESLQIAVPALPEVHPHPAHLRFHRNNIFKG